MRLSKKTLIVGGAGTALALALGGVALAYWSSTGTGSGTATTSSGDSSLVVTQTSAPTNLAPGVAAGPIAGTVKNTAANSAYVNTVLVTISSVTGPNITLATPCDATDYTLSNPTMTVQSDVANGATVTFGGATLGFNDKTTSNQDGCKSAIVHLAYASN
jgi:hypothetical protein